MKIFTERNIPEVIELLQRGKVGILRTDTLYGVVASASDKQAVERVYAVRGRDEHKPCIVLIADETQLLDKPEGVLVQFMREHWPGRVSIVVPSPNAPTYLTRGGGTVAYRMPDDDELRELLYETGPLVAPSANPQGEPPAQNVLQAREYFEESVDFYVDSGKVEDTQPSQLWHYQDEKMERLR